MLLIYPQTESITKKFVATNYPDCVVSSYIGRAWHDNRYIQVSLGEWYNGEQVHYEYYQGYWELHLEFDANDNENEKLKNYLNSHIDGNSMFKWHRWYNNRNKTRLRYEVDIETESDFLNGLKNLRDFVDPLFIAYHNGTTDVPHGVKSIKREMLSEIKCVSELPFEKLTIPYYQRPYRWKARNVNQLIDDLFEFKDHSEYRLGTLVLLENNGSYEIVDGQQRIITLSILLAEIIQTKKYDFISSDFQEFLFLFLNSQKFDNLISIQHIKETHKVIRRRVNEIDEKSVRFLIDRCKFVIIRLTDISEAFQFFDSQNARGKDLEPHDLLKAFHLREIVPFTERDKEQIKYWEDQETNELVMLFLYMYRIKRWTKMKSARFFTKDDVDTFKGLSLNDKHRYPFYQLLSIAHHYVNHYNEDWNRAVDGLRMEYPHQLDQQVVNGSRFFDMVRYYKSLLQSLNSIRFENGITKQILDALDTYAGRNRTGDRYVRELFDICLLYYMDKYGTDNMDAIVIKVFVWAYSIRLKQYSVQLQTIDNCATGSDSFFVMLRDTHSPGEVLNWNVKSIGAREIIRSEMEDLIILFKKLHYYEY